MALKNQQKQQGFTLVEIAIVLVIIGLLLGGVLKGQELINSAKQRSLVNELQAFKTGFYAYQDRYGMVPGAADDGTNPNRVTDGASPAAIAAGDTITETENFFKELYLAGLIKNSNYQLETQFGTGITANYDDADDGVIADRNQVCIADAPHTIASFIDTQIDDGTYNTGSVQASETYDLTATDTIDFVCVEL